METDLGIQVLTDGMSCIHLDLFCFSYSPCLGYNCMKYASCMDVSTEKGPNTTCVCQLARIMNEDRTEVGTFLYETDQFLRY